MPKGAKGQIRNHSTRFSLNLTPWDWLKKARTLRRAFNHLFIQFEGDKLSFDETFERNPSFDLQSPDDTVLMMILAFAIENLLKGLYVSTLKHVKRPNTLKELGLSQHKLVIIADKVGTDIGENFSENEVTLLAGLEQLILWRGRYPSPVDAEKAMAAFFAPSFRHPEYHFDACKLYDRLESLLTPRAPFSVQNKLFGKTYVGQIPE